MTELIFFSFSCLPSCHSVYPQRWKFSDQGLVRTEVPCFDFVLCWRLITKNSGHEWSTLSGKCRHHLISVVCKVEKDKEQQCS